MAPPKLPPSERTRHKSVSLLPREWAALHLIGINREPPATDSAMVREAVRDYLRRRLGPDVSVTAVAI